MRSAVPSILLVLLATACTPTATTGTQASPDDAISALAMPDGETIELISVLDGDSIEARVDGDFEEIRFLGINTPERTECWSQEARAATRELLETGTLTLVSAGRDRFGRLLGYVGAGEVFVNAKLVAEGHATAITNDHTYLDEFRDAEEAAFAGGLGLWGATACGPDLATEVRIDWVDGNPPGQDDDPRDGESATIVNEGGQSVDLGGWILRDESSTHRYEFPSGTTLGPGDDLVVYSVCGVHEYCFGEFDTVWSNGGDTALLLDSSGNVVDRYRFGG